MRIDPKYFNRFVVICAAITVIVIIFSTIRYFHRQKLDFKNNASELKADTLSFYSFSNQDSLYLNNFSNQPIIIHFWSTWSDKSKEVGNFLEAYTNKNKEITIIAAAVRDGDELVRDYIDNQSNSFHYVEGTALYQSLLTPGLPAQLFINQNEVIDMHVGNDTTEIKTKLDQYFPGE